MWYREDLCKNIPESDSLEILNHRINNSTMPC